MNIRESNQGQTFGAVGVGVAAAPADQADSYQHKKKYLAAYFQHKYFSFVFTYTDQTSSSLLESKMALRTVHDSCSYTLPDQHCHMPAESWDRHQPEKR